MAGQLYPNAEVVAPIAFRLESGQFRAASARTVVAAVAFKRRARALNTLEDMYNAIPTSAAREVASPTTLQLLVSHTAWANGQMFGALREVAGFETHPGADLIKRALDHIHVVRAIFQAHLQGATHGFTAPQRPVFPSLVELEREFEEIDRWYVETTASLSEAELERPRGVRFTDGKVVSMTPTTMILHVVTHTIHHRGNIDVIMLQAGMPRRRDGIPEFVVSSTLPT